MKKVCMMTTVSATMKTFILEQAKYQQTRASGELEITLVCSPDEAFAALVPETLRFVPIETTRGMSLSAIKTIATLYRFFKKERFDMVHYITINVSFCASIAARLARVPVRLYSQWGLRFQGFTGLGRRLMLFVERTICRNSTFITTDSRDSLEICRALGIYSTQNSEVVWNGSPNGVDFAKFDVLQKARWRAAKRAELGVPESAFAFGYVGRITRDKGINELFSAARRILADYENAALIIIGPKDNAEPICEELFEWSKAQPRIHYTGFTNEVEQYISTLDVSILPSYREGFGNVIIEAEAMQVPVIVTDISGARSAMRNGETGLLVAVKHVDALVAAMRRLYESPEERARMGQNGLAFVQGSFDQQVLYEKKLEVKYRLLGLPYPPRRAEG